MALKAASKVNSLNLLQSEKPLNTSKLKLHVFFTNHQQWQISRHLDSETGSLVFHIKDPFGISYSVTEFIVENLSPEFKESLSRLALVEEQQKLIRDYLQHLLSQMTSYQVHVEHKGNQLFLRFGDYGLKGGMQGDEKNQNILGETGALLASAVQVGTGIYFSIGRSSSWKIGGGALISAGLASGLYAYQTREDRKKYTDLEYAKQLTVGLFAGLVTNLTGLLTPEGAGRWAKMGYQALVSAVGSATSTAIPELVANKKRIRLKIIAKKTLIGGIGGGAGAVTGTLVQSALNSDIVNRTGELFQSLVSQFPKYSEEMGVSCALTLKKMIESGLSSGCSKLAIDVCENLEEEDPTKRKDLSAVKKEAFQSAVISALISGAITAFEQKQKIQEYNKIKTEIEQTQKELEDARTQKAQRESCLQDLRKDLNASQQKLVEKQKMLKLQEESLHQNRLRQQQIQNAVEKDQQAIHEAEQIVFVAEKELLMAQQALMDVQNQVEKYQQSISEAQSAVGTAQEQLHRAHQTAQEVQRAHAALAASIDKNVRRHLKKGYKAKVNGHYTKSEVKIRNAYLQGGKIEWKKGQNRFFGSRETIKTKQSPLMGKYQQAQEHVKQTEQKIQEMQSTVNQKQTELKAAQNKVTLHHQEMDRTQAEIKAAQEVQLKQAELNAALDQLKSFQQEIQQTQQDMLELQGAIGALEQQASQFEVKFQEEQSKLQEVLMKESGLATLSNEQQAVICKTQQDYDQFLRSGVDKQYFFSLKSTTLKKAFKPEPVSYVDEDFSMEELISHVVLVQALNSDLAEHYSDFEWARSDDPFYVHLCCLKGVVTSYGVMGHHIQLKKIEFNEYLPDRPHMHWSWNQLVQPNSGGNWENAPIGVLEPLSTFEEGVYYKPFGVAPYDTFTFNSHTLSERSLILVPEPIAVEAQNYLREFRGRVVPYNGRLRTAIIDALQAHYPETWHICDKNGELTGRTETYSAGGHGSYTCVKKIDGKVVVLIKNAGHDAQREHTSEAIKEYHRNKRFIGLHMNSITFWIEDGRLEGKDDAYFTTLKEFKKKPAIVRNHPSFAGGIRNFHEIGRLGALQAFTFYQRSLAYDAKTGILDVANYLINEAIYADLVSLFYQMYPATEFDLSVLDLKMIIESIRYYLLTLLDDIDESMKVSNQEEKREELFQVYVSILRQGLIDLKQAKKEVFRLTILESEKQLSDKFQKKPEPLCLLVAKEEWAYVDTPAHSIAFDLGRNWPCSSQLNDYANKVLRTLPIDFERLKELYQQLACRAGPEIRTPEERREQYRLNIISSIIQWSMQEKLYLAARQDDIVDYSILANKLSNQLGCLAEYGLEADDFTKNIGDCLFDNVVAQLVDRSITSLELRRAVVHYMQEKSNEYADKPDFDDNVLFVGDGEQSLFFENWGQYLARMNEPQVWGTELEIKAIANMLDCPIVVLTTDLQPKIYNSEGTKSPLFLHHVHTNHFGACVPFKGLTIEDVYHAIKQKVHF